MAIENLVQLLRARALKHPGRPFLRFHRAGAWSDWSYGLVLRRVEAIAGGLEVLGVRPGDRVAILAGARPEWLLAELGGLAAGAAVLALDPALPAEEAARILDHAGARVVFLDDRGGAARLAGVRYRLPQLDHLVLLEGEAPDDVDLFSLAALEALAAPGQGAARLDRTARRPRAAPAAICYTRGTTGLPKGAILTHGNVLATVGATARALRGALDGVRVLLSPVPPSHTLGRVCAQLASLCLGRTLALGRGPGRILDDAAELRPHAIIASPRMVERLHDELGGRPAGDRLGGRLSLLLTGGAPLEPALGRAFETAGIRVCDGWGLAETAGPVALNRPGESRPGSAGLPLPGVEVRLAGDGELLVHGPNVFDGYVGDPERTDEAFDEHGFLRTGDLGAIDEAGFVHVFGRKEEMIVTIDGWRVAPRKLERLLCERPLIAGALAHGHQRPFIVALLTLDRDAVAAWHPELRDRPLGDPELHAAVEEEVRRVNDRLPHGERIRAFRLLDGDAARDLPASRPLARRDAEARYRSLLDALYAGEQVASRPA